MDIDKLFLTKIREAESIVIFAHHYPDGDCLGSEMGLKKVLLANFPDKKVYAVGENSTKWEWVFGKVDIVDDETVANSLAIIVDHNSFTRCGDKRVQTCKDGIRFDHHIGGLVPFPFPAIVEENATSASQVILEFCIRCKLALPVSAVNDFLVAFIDDKRQYAEDNAPADIEEMEDLFAILGGDFEKANLYVFSKNEKMLEYEQKILDSRILDGDVCYVIMQKADYEALGIPFAEAGALSSLILENTEVAVALLFTYSDNEIRLSARSRGAFSVQRLCEAFGGGGHAQAAGAVFFDMSFNLRKVVEKAKEILEEDPSV